MEFPEASEPVDATLPPAASGAADDRVPGRKDLSAVPTFLRGRAGASGRLTPQQLAAPAPAGTAPDVTTLPILAVAPRRLLLIVLTLVLGWLIASFGRQVAEASAASARADELRAATAALSDEVSGLERELQTIQDQRYISLAARAFRLGTAQEIPFALEANAPPLPADAPGSAAARLGAQTETRTPLEHWLDILFGPGD